jgi:virginiamycin A acetyltransferase
MLLPQPIDVPVTDKIAIFFKLARIYTASDLDYARNGNIGWLRIGEALRFHNRIEIEQNCAIFGGPYRGMIGVAPPSSGFCSIGFFSFSSSPLPEPLRVGRYCSISFDLTFLDTPHPTTYISTSCFNMAKSNVRRMLSDGLPGWEKFEPGWQGDSKAYPEIGDDVWIGYNVTLAMGIKIGTGAIIAANATVTKDVPPYAVVAGNPGVIKKYRFKEPEIKAMLDSRWWEFSYADFRDLPLNNPCAFTSGLLERESAGKVRRFLPKRIVLPDMFLQSDV